MKKTLGLIIVLTMILIIAACSKTDNSTVNGTVGMGEIQSGSIPWVVMKNSTRINTSDPFSVAVLVSQTTWPSTGNGNRPGGVILVDINDWHAGLVGADLIHFPINGPVLFTEQGEIPEITLNEIKRLNPTGFKAKSTIHAVLVGNLASRVGEQLSDIKLKFDQIPGENPAQLAKAVDAYYSELLGSIPNSVIIGALHAPEYALPAINWISHMSEPLLFVSKDDVPQETVDALLIRKGGAHIYILGPESIISANVEQQLSNYGKVTRISGNDPIANSIPFAQFYDAETQFGWGITTPGHNLSFIPVQSTSLAIAAAPFSHLGKHAPLIWIDQDRVPQNVMSYLDMIQPKYTNTPSDGPFNHAWITGDMNSISHVVHGEIDQMLEIISATGGGHGDHSGH